jgi:hypothetical protein
MNLMPQAISIFEQNMRRIVGAAGGKWLGIQNAVFPDMLPVLSFTNPETGTLSSIRIDPISYDETALYLKIREMLDVDKTRAEGRYVRVPVRVLRELAVKLLKLAEEIAALYEEKQ